MKERGRVEATRTETSTTRRRVLRKRAAGQCTSAHNSSLKASQLASKADMQPDVPRWMKHSSRCDQAPETVVASSSTLRATESTAVLVSLLVQTHSPTATMLQCNRTI